MPQPYLMCGRIARTLVCLVGCVVLLAACDRANTADQASAYDPDSTALTDVLLPSRAYFDEGRYDSAAVLAKAMLDSAQRRHLPSQQVNTLNALGRM